MTCVFVSLFVSHPVIIPYHEGDTPLLCSGCYVLHTYTHRYYHFSLANNYRTEKLLIHMDLAEASLPK